ncbi:MAG: AAA family ATPase [Acidobacteriota bacterium]
MEVSQPVLTDQEVPQVIERMTRVQEQVISEVRKIIVGQDDVINLVLICLYAGGHAMITGLPGLAKTLLIRCVADTLGLNFKRIQFTPDLMPSDITGTDIIEENHATGRREMRFVSGPIFANLLLADEINRTPPKTQSALLEAMQEHTVTVRGTNYVLEPPFFVLATQNPIELEGTYPLPEAQLDRFMFNIIIDYLNEGDEVDVVRNTTSRLEPKLRAVAQRQDILLFQQLVRKVPISDDVTRYAVHLARFSRPVQEGAPEFVKKWVSYGASLRAAQYMVLGGKARALMNGRYNVAIEDIQALAPSVMRHRILLNFHAEAERITSDNIIGQLLEFVPRPKSGL